MILKTVIFILAITLTSNISFSQTKKNQDMTTVKNDEETIRELENKFASAFNAGDINAMMKSYVPDKSLVVFDVVPPRQHLGADEYRKAWVGFFSHFKDTPKIAITDLGISVAGNLGFSHSIQHVTGTDTQGHPVDRTVRVTDGYRKIGDNWLIVLEHVSVPVDLKTGKGDFTSKP
jgi:ketosteroid isomerase-like protein